MSQPSQAIETSVNAAGKVQALIDLTEALNLIFAEENTALEERRHSDVAPLQAEKARLAAAYAQSIRSVSVDRFAVSAVDGALLMKLRSMTATFEARAARQRRLLDDDCTEANSAEEASTQR